MEMRGMEKRIGILRREKKNEERKEKGRGRILRKMNMWYVGSNVIIWKINRNKRKQGK